MSAHVILDVPPTETLPPRLPAIARRIALSLVIACVIPATLFYVVLRVSGIWPAILAALVFSYVALAWQALTGRRTSGLLMLTALVLTGRTLVALLADSTFLYFLQPIISDGVVATVFLLSLASQRPLVARMAGDFYPMDHECSMRPRVRRLFWWLTLMWAMFCVGKSVMTLWMLESLSVEHFVLAKGLGVLGLNVTAIAVTVAVAFRVARSEGLLHPRT